MKSLEEIHLPGISPHFVGFAIIKHSPSADGL
jgi:hypothetical protein